MSLYIYYILCIGDMAQYIYIYICIYSIYVIILTYSGSESTCMNVGKTQQHRNIFER